MADEFIKFVDRFAALHRRAKIAPLPPPEQADYEELRELFARAMCDAQNVLVPAGRSARSFFRVHSVFKVEITLEGSTQKTSTMDVSMNGFTSIAAVPPAVGAAASFKMTLSPRTVIAGEAIVAGAEKDRLSNQHRVSFTFAALAAGGGPLLETALFDSVLLRSVTPMPFAAPAAAPPRRHGSTPEMKRVSSTTPVPVVRTPQATPALPLAASAPRGAVDGASRARSEPTVTAARPVPQVERKVSVDDLLADAVQEMRGSTEAARREIVPELRPARRRVLPRVLAMGTLVGAVAIGVVSLRARFGRTTASVPAPPTAAIAAPPSAPVATADAPRPAPPETPRASAPAADAGAPVKAATPAVGTIHVTVSGRRVYIDGRLVGEGPRAFPVSCGAHKVRVGSRGTTRHLDVRCGSVVDVTKP